MAFCQKGWATVKDLLHHITPVLDTIISGITDITGRIKALEGTITVQALVGIIPGGSLYEAELNSAMDVLVPTLQTVGGVTDKIAAWLDGKSSLEINSNLVKLAAVAAKHSDAIPDAVKTESFYDAAVQIHTMVASTLEPVESVPVPSE